MLHRAQDFEQIERSADIDLKIMPRIDEATRDCDLRREVKYLIRAPNGGSQSVSVLDIGRLDVQPFRKGLLQPCKIAFGAGTREVVVDHDGPAGGEEPARQIGTD